MRRLRISSDLSLGLDFVTKTAAILAQRRKGKTYTASVLAEELVAAKVPFVALDPTGAWWGLRANAKGDGAGLPVVIIGGAHGDLPLERAGGKLAAELVVDSPGFYVIDFSLFESGEAERQFATDFAERLYRLKARAGNDFALHLLVDESNRFVPQRPLPGDQRMLGAFEALVLRGGLRGIGTTLISQRAAVVNKNVLEQIDVLIALRVVGPNDRKAIDGYVSAVHGDDELRRELMGSLASLKLGEAWVWEPGGDPALFERIRIRERKTFNSSATPKPGETRVEPRVLARVEIENLKTLWAETIKRAEAEDPKRLQARIRELERQLAGRPTERVEVPVDRIVEVEVPALPEADLLELKRAAEAFLEVQAGGFWADVEKVARAAAGILEQAAHPRKWIQPTPRQPRARGRELPPAVEPPKVLLSDRRAAAALDGELASGERKMLAAIALHYPQPVKPSRAATVGGFSRRSSQPSALLRGLKEKGLVEQDPATKLLILTPAGQAAADVSRIPNSRAELLAYWRGRIGAGERAFLDELVRFGASSSTSVSTRELAEQLGYSTASSQPTAILRSLKAYGLVEQYGGGWRAIEDLIERAGVA
jgi:hypothetical protein